MKFSLRYLLILQLFFINWIIQEFVVHYLKWSFQKLICKCELSFSVAELHFLSWGEEYMIPNILSQWQMQSFVLMI